MVDLFNKKKMSELKELCEAYRKEREKYRDKYIEKKSDYDKVYELNQRLIEENRTLINWIEKMINEVGIYEINKESSVRIPIQKQAKIWEGGLTQPRVDHIRIPEIDFEIWR